MVGQEGQVSHRGRHQELEAGLRCPEVARLTDTELDQAGETVFGRLPRQLVGLEVGTVLQRTSLLEERLLGVHGNAAAVPATHALGPHRPGGTPGRGEAKPAELTLAALAARTAIPRDARLAGLGTDYGAAQMTYDLRRLRLHGLIERLPRSHTYVLTPDGLRVALFYTKVHDRLFQPLLAADHPPAPPDLRQAPRILDHANADYVRNARIGIAA